MVSPMPSNFNAEVVACFGQRVDENPTGAMQEAAFAALGLNWRYLTVDVAAGDLREAIGGVRRFGTCVGAWRVGSDMDLLVNATSMGLYPDCEAMPDVDLSGAKPGMLVSDVVFNPPETPLLAMARRRGLPVLDGLSMLVYQGVIG